MPRENRTENLLVRVTASELTAWRKRADQLGLSLSDFVRDTLNDALPSRKAKR